MVGEADSKETSRPFRHWRTRMFDTQQTVSAFGEYADGCDGGAVARLL